MTLFLCTDILISNIFLRSSYLFIIYIHKLKCNNIWLYLILISFYDLYFINWPLVNTIMVIALFLFNEHILKRYNKIVKILLDFILYILILQLIYNNLDIVKAIEIIITFIVETFIITHIFPRFGIDLLR